MDLELKELGHYRGTEQYHKIQLFSANLTDGIMYLMENGYSWFITDVLAVLEHHKSTKGQEFICAKLKLNDSKAEMVLTDGNDNVLYTQKYEYTEAKQELTLFFTNGVLLLNSEY